MNQVLQKNLMVVHLMKNLVAAKMMSAALLMSLQASMDQQVLNL